MMQNKMENSKMPLVSICIPNYNYGQYIGHCLESVYNQTYPNLEVYVRDNMSTDNSYEVALSYREKFMKKGIFYSVSQNCRNMGSSHNSQLATRDVEGDFVYTLASDDAIKPEFIEKCINVFLKNPSVGTVITHREEIDENDRIHQSAPFYNQSCIIDGESQAAVYMMAGIAIPGQRLISRNVMDKSNKYTRVYEVAGDWYDNFIYSCFGDVAYIAEPLCQYRVHTGNETNESEKNLLGIFEHYQLINAFKQIALSFGMRKPVERYDEAVKKLGSMCLRYTYKMLVNNMNDVAKRYLDLAIVFDKDINGNPMYEELKNMADLQSEDLRIELIRLEKNEIITRSRSYDPPEGFIAIDSRGNVLP